MPGMAACDISGILAGDFAGTLLVAGWSVVCIESACVAGIPS